MSHSCVITTLLAAALLMSCAGSGRKVDNAQYQAFQEGKTTRGEIVAALGEPGGSTWVGSEETLTYSFDKIDSRMMIPIVGTLIMAADGIKSEAQRCGFTVGKNQILVTKTCSGFAQKVVGIGG